MFQVCGEDIGTAHIDSLKEVRIHCGISALTAYIYVRRQDVKSAGEAT